MNKKMKCFDVVCDLISRTAQFLHKKMVSIGGVYDSIGICQHRVTARMHRGVQGRQGLAQMSSTDMAAITQHETAGGRD